MNRVVLPASHEMEALSLVLRCSFQDQAAAASTSAGSPRLSCDSLFSSLWIFGVRLHGVCYYLEISASLARGAVLARMSTAAIVSTCPSVPRPCRRALRLRSVHTITLYRRKTQDGPGGGRGGHTWRAPSFVPLHALDLAGEGGPTSRDVGVVQGWGYGERGGREGARLLRPIPARTRAARRRGRRTRGEREEGGGRKERRAPRRLSKEQEGVMGGCYGAACGVFQFPISRAGVRQESSPWTSCLRGYSYALPVAILPQDIPKCCTTEATRGARRGGAPPILELLVARLFASARRGEDRRARPRSSRRLRTRAHTARRRARVVPPADAATDADGGAYDVGVVGGYVRSMERGKEGGLGCGDARGRCQSHHHHTHPLLHGTSSSLRGPTPAPGKPYGAQLAALSIVVSIGFIRFWRARVVDSSARLSLHQSAGKATFPPLLRLYDAYIDWDAELVGAASDRPAPLDVDGDGRSEDGSHDGAS
ncbi:hypothetical protein B0H14DRAFT_3709820 [Mycena olivaceomarginata]|nr:hypothetical protein B0H14DRAFT_3709820 [Mycena olivaceomarginata]